MVLTFTGLGALVVVPPPYVFLVGGLIFPFSNCPLLKASSILVSQSHNSPNELIGDDKKPTIINRKQVFDDHVNLVFLICLLTILDALVFHLVMYSEKVSPTPCLVVFKSLNVTSITVLKMNWSINNFTSLFYTLVLLRSRL